MKLDLIAIEKLCPRGLYPLADVRALISILARVISLNIGSGLSICSAGEARTYAHMLMRNTRILRKHQQHNRNLKIKAWVLQCPARISEVRAMIGEAAIRAWIKRMRAAYFAPPPKQAGPKIPVGQFESQNHMQVNADFQTDFHAGSEAGLGRIFALARLADVEKLLPFRPRWPRNICAYGSKRCGIRGETSQARKNRRPEPVRFFPPELGVNIDRPKTPGQAAARYLDHDPGDNSGQTLKYTDPYTNRQARFLLKKPP